MWYYPDGMANILLHYKLIFDSKWSVNHSSYKFKKSGDVRDLSIDCVTSEGIKVRFFPTAEGLHIMDCSEYLKEGKPTYVFGKKITDNIVDGGNAMCNTFLTTFLNAGKLNNLDGINTVANRKGNFFNRDQEKAQLVQCFWKLVQRFQQVSGHPSNKVLIYSAIINGIKNSPITKRDVLMMLEQLGQSKYALQGKTVR